MAKYEIPIGAARVSVEIANGYIRWDFFSITAGVAIPSEVLANPSAPAYMARLEIGGSGDNSNRIRLSIGSSPRASDLGFNAGQELTSNWEQFVRALTIRVGRSELHLVGPDSVGATGRDSSEPYDWHDSNHQNFQAFVRAFARLGFSQQDSAVLVFDDGLYNSVRGSVSTGTPRVGGHLIGPAPPALYSLDPDRSTSDPLPAGSDGIKVLVEVSPFLSRISSFLPPGRDARPLLLDTPEIREGFSLGQGGGDITVALDNRDGDFQEDMVGGFIQVWSLSLGAVRSAYIGQITGQRITPIECVFSVSTLPVESMQTQVPARVMEEAVFPRSELVGRTVPVVLGRALRHRCLPADQGVDAELVYDADSGAQDLVLSNSYSIAMGDALIISLGSPEEEEVRVSSVSGLDVRLTAALVRNHAGGASVASAGTVRDYLLGEGVWSAGNWKEVYRVYHDGRALPELVCPQHSYPVTLRPGEQSFELDSQHRVQMHDWYRNYYIEFLDAAGTVTGGSRVGTYDPERNTVSISLVRQVSFVCYRMREYLFFDGSQDAPHAGYAFIRLARAYPREIRADVRGFDLTSPASVISEFMKNPTWGTGVPGRISFRRPLPGGYRLEGVFDSKRRLVDVLSDIGLFRPLRVLRKKEGIVVEFEGETASASLPPDEDAYISPPRREMARLEDRKTAVEINYRQDHASGDILLTRSEEVEDFNGRQTGREKSLALPRVYDPETADRVAVSSVARELSAREMLTFSIDPRQIDGEIYPARRLTLPGGLVSANETEWVATEVSHVVDAVITVTARKYLPSLYAYPAGRDVPGVSDSYAPETDFSQTPPEPLRDFHAETIAVTVGTETVYDCQVTFKKPLQNCEGVEIWFALGDGDLTLVTEEDPENPGSARFELPVNLERYKVVGYSLSANRLLRGFPVEVNVNQSPVADAGDDRSVGAGARVTLDGSGSNDPDGDPLTYSWRQISGPVVSLADADKARATFRAPSGGTTQTLGFELTVSDGAQTSSDSVVITARRYVPPVPVAPPRPPRIVCTETVSRGEVRGEYVTITVTGCIVEGDPPPGYRIVSSGIRSQLCTVWDNPNYDSRVNGCTAPITLTFRLERI